MRTTGEGDKVGAVISVPSATVRFNITNNSLLSKLVLFLPCDV